MRLGIFSENPRILADAKELTVLFSSRVNGLGLRF